MMFLNPGGQYLASPSASGGADRSMSLATDGRGGLNTPLPHAIPDFQLQSFSPNLTYVVAG
jgi:hypothetical protein